MSRIRAILIVWVALAYAGAPLALDACARACASAAPACHHESSASPHIGHAPEICGQDHDAVRLRAASVGSLALQAPGDLTPNGPVPGVPLFQQARHRFASPPITAAHSLSAVPLRL